MRKKILINRNMKENNKKENKKIAFEKKEEKEKTKTIKIALLLSNELFHDTYFQICSLQKINIYIY